MNPIELRTYKLQIEHSDGLTTNDIIDEILVHGNFPDELVPPVIEALRAGKYIHYNSICDILLSTKSKDLYQFVKTKKRLSNWDLVRLLSAGYPDPEIESKLCKVLYKCFKDNTDFLRSEIVEAMGKHGTKESMEILEVIEYELDPIIQVRKIEITAQPEPEAEIKLTNLKQHLPVLELKCMVTFFEKVRKAKANIYKRIKISKTNESSSVQIVQEPSLSETKHSLTETTVIDKLIDSGESDRLEFKSTLRWNLHTNSKDPKIEHATLKSIVAFLNTEGGTLLIGVEDNGNVLGIQEDNFKTEDKYQLHFVNIVNERIGKEYATLIKGYLQRVENKQVFRVECSKSPTPVFLTTKGQDDFFIRTGPSTVQLNSKETYEYIQKHFSK